NLNMRNYVEINSAPVPRSDDAPLFGYCHIATKDSKSTRRSAGGPSGPGATPSRCFPWGAYFKGPLQQWAEKFLQTSFFQVGSLVEGMFGFAGPPISARH